MCRKGEGGDELKRKGDSFAVGRLIAGKGTKEGFYEKLGVVLARGMNMPVMKFNIGYFLKLTLKSSQD